MNATAAIFTTLGTINSLIGRVGVFVGSLFIAIMTILVILGVFFRYVLNNSLGWVEDVSLIMMVTTAFLVAPFAYRSGANVAIEFLSGMLQGRMVRIMRIIINLLVLWLIYRYFLESLGLVKRGWGIRVNTVPIPWAIPYMVVPFSFVAMALVGFELIMRDLWGLMSGSDKADLPHVAPQEPE
ncbi:MAG: TRAP transporter small permease subunit [Nitratireductor sp.]